jgi:thioredoxin 1
MPQIITKDTFDKEVLQSDLPVLIDFWAAWCGPCQRVSPIVEEIEKEYAGRLKVGKVNVDEESALGEKYSILSIPALFIFKGGEKVGEVIGLAPKATIEAQLALHIN